MDIPSFCERFELDNEIKVKFLEHGFRSTLSFAHISVDQLKQMFRVGEVAELKVAVEAWALPKE